MQLVFIGQSYKNFSHFYLMLPNYRYLFIVHERLKQATKWRDDSLNVSWRKHADFRVSVQFVSGIKISNKAWKPSTLMISPRTVQCIQGLVEKTLMLDSFPFFHLLSKHLIPKHTVTDGTRLQHLHHSFLVPFWTNSAVDRLFQRCHWDILVCLH